MELRKAKRHNAKIKMGIQGPSGSGKTMSALLLAYGLCKDWSKIAVIDTENHSSELYAHLGSYQVLGLSAPFSPERYIEAIQFCEKEGMAVVIIDSITHEWDGMGGIIDIHGSMAGNSFTNWNKLTPRHNAFIQTMLQCNTHIIATIRTKQDYVLSEKNGKHVPEKVGLKGIQRDGVEYDLTLVLDLDIKNHATASKDRTSLFINRPEFKITAETGAIILSWCKEGISAEDIRTRIQEVTSVEELLRLYKANPPFQELLLNDFTTRRHQLENIHTLQSLSPNTKKFSQNGTYH